MKLALASALLPVTLLVLGASPTRAADQDVAFFQGVAGDWSGPGEIVNGKYKGTKFVCSFKGSVPETAVGMTMDGACRVGVFTQKMVASVQRQGRDVYRGKFQDGAAGKGLDIVSGNVVSDQKVIFGLDRAQLKGALLAKMADPNTMRVTVSVRVENELVPVIGMSLKRVDGDPVGSIAD